MSSPKIIVDHAETNSRLPDLLLRAGADVRTERLGEGDYLLSAAFAVERKTSVDLVNSLLQRRLLDQLDRLSSAYEYGALLIEGDGWAHDRRLKSPILAEAYQWISLRPNLTVIASPDVEYSAKLLTGIARAEQYQRHAAPPTPAAPVAKAKKPADALRALPGIGRANANALIARFGSFRAAANATLAELQETVGPGRGATLHAFLNRSE